MSKWLVVVDRLVDLPEGAGAAEIMTTRDYIAGPLAAIGPRKVVNLARSQGYQTLGYYVSLLAEARGHKVLPTVGAMLELRGKKGYAHRLPELEETLNRIIRRMDIEPEGNFRLVVCLGEVEDPRFERLGAELFDAFRVPVLEVFVAAGTPWTIKKIAPVPLAELGAPSRARFTAALAAHTQTRWRPSRAKAQPRFDLAVLHDPAERLPPSDTASLKRFARLAEGWGLGVELITRKQQDELAEFDALWIRATTNIDHYTWRFARAAEQEGMPVIDDPTSIVRCTNKIYLAELLQANNVPHPKTRIAGTLREAERLERDLGWPMVLKIPDGSFSRGVHKVGDREELNRTLRMLFDDTELVLAQEFMPTAFDWRIGVLDGEPLFACQYLMARNHWQIVKHGEGGKALEGAMRAVQLAAAPAQVVQTAVKAARLIGRGLYGVDIKQNDRGVFVIEVNDNPNLVHGEEDDAEGDVVWRKITDWFLMRLG